MTSVITSNIMITDVAYDAIPDYPTPDSSLLSGEGKPLTDLETQLNLISDFTYASVEWNGRRNVQLSQRTDGKADITIRNFTYRGRSYLGYGPDQTALQAAMASAIASVSSMVHNGSVVIHGGCHGSGI